MVGPERFELSTSTPPRYRPVTVFLAQTAVLYENPAGG